jgi:hypothetical protein
MAGKDKRSNFRRFATQTPQRDHVGQSDAIFKAVDLSLKPTSNDRMAKLGHYQQTYLGSVYDYDPVTGRTRVADGAHVNDERGHVPLEPDNVVMRDHDGGKDRVWALRLIADHDNKWQEQRHRSTDVIDQCDKQNWAHLSDLVWVKKLGATSRMGLNDAGISAKLLNVKAKTDLGALMLNIGKKAGFVTDGNFAGQFWHNHHLSPIGEAAEPPCAEVIRKQMTFRGDSVWDMNGELVTWAFDDEKGTPQGDTWVGNHWISDPSPIPPKGELNPEAKSNQPTLPRRFDKGIWVWVKHPTYYIPNGSNGYDYTGVPPTCQPVPTTTYGADTGEYRPPVPTYQCGYQVGAFEPGYITGVTASFMLPEKTPNLDLRLVIPFRMPVALALGEAMRFSVFYKYALKCGDHLGDGVPYAEVPFVLAFNNTLGVAPDTLLTAAINFANIGDESGQMGGLFKVHFMRRSDDGVLKDFLLADDMRMAIRSAGQPRPAVDQRQVEVEA